MGRWRLAESAAAILTRTLTPDSLTRQPNINGFQAEIGLYDPSTEQSSVVGLLDETDTPRFEGELSYTTAFSGGSFQVWVDGLWQDIESSAAGATADVQVTGYGFGANMKLHGFDVVGYYYNGEGLGRSLQFLEGPGVTT